MLRVRPRSTWRRATSQVEVAALIMYTSLRFRTPDPQTEISCRETGVRDLDCAVAVRSGVRRGRLVWPHERRDPREDHFHGVRRGTRGDRLGGASCGGSHTQGARRPAGLAQADRLGELRLPGCATDHGDVVQRQVRRGHRRSPVLRGLPERRHGRVAGRRARTRAVRCAVRLCAAALRHRCQPRRLLVDPGQPGGDTDAGAPEREERQRAVRGRLGDAAPRVRQPAAARHVPGCRRTPHPRVPPEHQREDVPPAAVRHRPRDRPARLRQGGRQGP